MKKVLALTSIAAATAFGSSPALAAKAQFACAGTKVCYYSIYADPAGKSTVGRFKVNAGRRVAVDIPNRSWYCWGNDTYPEADSCTKAQVRF